MAYKKKAKKKAKKKTKKKAKNRAKKQEAPEWTSSIIEQTAEERKAWNKAREEKELRAIKKRRTSTPGEPGVVREGA